MRAFGAYLSLVVTAGCVGSEAPDCRVGGDCASGICLADGTCAPLDGDAGVDASGNVDAAGAGFDAAGCADNDGVIARDDVTLEAGRTATFRIALDTPVDIAGTIVLEDGVWLWDWTGPFGGDHDVPVTTIAPAGTWWAGEFPSATYAAKLSDEQELLGVFEATVDALLLLGVVSPTSGVSQTLVHHTPPVTVLSFPIERNATWGTDANVSGQANGFAAAWTEGYSSSVDAWGHLTTPYGQFPVLRVATTLLRTVGFAQTTVRTVSFVSECYGVVGVAVSQDDAPMEFTDAAEVRRLAP